MIGASGAVARAEILRWKAAYELAFCAQCPPRPSRDAIVAFHEIAAEEYVGLLAKDRMRARAAARKKGAR